VRRLRGTSGHVVRILAELRLKLKTCVRGSSVPR
jgi:hypothetical protein